MKAKEPTTFDQQVNILKERGLLIPEDKTCENFLHSVNYYRLTAYLLPFKQENNTYKTGTTFEELHQIYEFDRKLSHLIFSIIEEIELFLRTQFAYYHAHRYGALGYLDPENFNDMHNPDDFSDRIDHVLYEHRFSPVVIHHQKNYDGILPIWAIIEFFSIGMLSKFYSDMILKDKKDIARQLFNTSYSCLDSWLRCLSDLRNRCAHYSRLYYWKFTAIPKSYPNSFFQRNRRLFDQLLVLQHLYTNNFKWHTSFMVPLQTIMEEYKDHIYLEHIGFPQEWYSLLNK